MELGAHEDQPCNAWRRSLGGHWQRYTKMVMGTFAYPVATQDHCWQLTGKPRHQYQYDPFHQASSGRP